MECGRKREDKEGRNTTDPSKVEEREKKTKEKKLKEKIEIYGHYLGF